MAYVKMPKDLTVGGQGRGLEVIFTRVSYNEYWQLSELCSLRKKTLRILELKSESNIKYIGCEKDIYCEFRKEQGERGNIFVLGQSGGGKRFEHKK